MSRTKQEVRDWLEKQINHTLSDPQGNWSGECVTLIKCLMDFLGVPEPYAARGHAKDAANTYLDQGIASNGKGYLTICVNSTWGNGYGHIWADLQDEHSYEQNGKVYHVVTKDTKKISSATQWVNFDKWIKEEEVITKDQENVMSFLATGDYPGVGYDYRFVGQPFSDAFVNFWNDVSQKTGLQKMAKDAQSQVTKPQVLDYINKNLK